MHGEHQSHDTSNPSAGTPAPTVGAERQLLFGIIALQSDFLTRAQLVAGFDAWVHDKSRTLAEILVEQGALASDDREILERLVGKFVEKHGGNAERSLAALSSVPHVRLDLEQFNDPDLAASLGHVGKSEPVDPNLATTLLQPDGGSSLGRFRILRPHAKGGLGQVSVALDQDLNREVALKEILPQHADDRVSRERFILEAEVTGGLEHPGIVPVYALGQGPDGRPYYAMRFVKGDSLKQAIEAFHKPDNPNRNDPGARQLALRQLLGRFIDVCNAMEYAHSRGVLHRDLKPGNIMVGKYGETLVVDWGLAKSLGKKEIGSGEATLRPMTPLSSSGQTRPGSAIGTPAYMSPEQAAGKLDELGPASDVYGLGATLYHLLCGKPPFDKKDEGEILQRVQRADYPKPRLVAPEVPAALEAVCLKAMALQSSGRYQTARALADDLEHWLADEPVAAAPDSVGDRLSRLVRRHRGYVRAGAAALVVIAVISIVAALLVNEQRRQNALLAISERDLKTKAQRLAHEMGELADRNARLADDERSGRLATERQLRIANAERMSSLSYVKRTDSPELGLLLAVESGLRTLQRGEGLLPSSQQAVIDALTGIGGRPLIGHSGEIGAVATSPDGRWVVTGSNDKTVRIWDLTSELSADNPKILHGHEGGVAHVAVSPDGHLVVSGSSDGTIRVWDLRAESRVPARHVLKNGPRFMQGFDLSADGRWIVAGGENIVRLWDLNADDPAEHEYVLTLPEQSHINRVMIRPDNRQIVAMGFGIWTWELGPSGPMESHKSFAALDDRDSMYEAAFTPNCRWLVTGSWSGAVHIWDLSPNGTEQRPRLLEGHRDAVRCVVISPDGHWVVTGSKDKTARVWDLTAEDPAANPRILRGHTSQVYRAAFFPDSRTVVTGSVDHTARVWELDTDDLSNNSRELIGHEAPINSVAVSADGQWIVTGSFDTRARVWSARPLASHANPKVVPLGKHVDRWETSANRRWLITGSRDNNAIAWDLSSTSPSFSPRILAGYRYEPPSLLFEMSPDSRWVVTQSAVWDLDKDGPEITPYRFRDEFPTSPFSADSRWLVVTHSQFLRVWNLLERNPADVPSLVLSGNKDQVTAIAISPNSRWLVTGSHEGAVHLWDLDTAHLWFASPRILRGHQASISSIVFTPDGQWIITTSSDGTARVWDATAKDPTATALTWELCPPERKTENGSEFTLIKLAISPDSRWVLTAADRNLQVRDLKSDDPGSRSLPLSGHQGSIGQIAVSPDGRWAVTQGADNTVRVWDLEAADPTLTHRIIRYGVPVQQFAISPDSQWIAVQTGQKSVSVSGLSSGEPSTNSCTLTGFDGFGLSLQFAPDSRRILMVAQGEAIQSWKWRWDDLLTLGSEVGRNFTRKEWSQYFPDEPYRKTFPTLPITEDPE